MKVIAASASTSKTKIEDSGTEGAQLKNADTPQRGGRHCGSNRCAGANIARFAGALAALSRFAAAAPDQVKRLVGQK